jgi:hypothetical protein
MNDIIRLKITFNYEYIDHIDKLLSKIKIIHKTFENSVSYLFDVNQNDAEKLIYYLLLITSKQIKIENVSSINQSKDLPEVGTDKPIGSKDAIDEN